MLPPVSTVNPLGNDVVPVTVRSASTVTVPVASVIEESTNVLASLLTGITLSVVLIVVPPNKPLAVEADPLKAATEAAWSVVVNEADIC